MTKSIRKMVGRAACALGIVAVFASASFAESRVYVRLGDGRVVYTTRSYWHRHYPAGVVVNALPGAYVNEPYTYAGGYPVYYHQNYWRAHHRQWGHRHSHHHHHH